MSPTRRGWLVVGASTIALIVSVNALILTPYGVMMDPIAKDFGWTRAAVSNGLSIYALAAAIVMPFAGRLLDGLGIRKVGIPSVLLTALSMIGLAYCPPNQGLWYGLMAFLGVVSVGQGGLTYLKVASEWIDRNRGLAVGLVGTGIAVGQAVAPAFTELLMTTFGGWRPVFIGLAVLLVVLALPPLLFVVREPDAAERFELGLVATPSSRELPGLETGEAIRTRQFWILLLTTLVLGCAAPGALVHMVPLMTDQGISPAQAVAALSAAGLSAMVGRLIGGFLVDRFYAPLVAAVVFVLPALGFWFLSGHTHVPGLPLVGAILVGMAMGGESDLVSYMTSRYLGMKRFGLIFGIYYALLALGYAIGPFVFAQSYSATGNYDMAFWIFGIGLVVCALGGLTMGRYRYPAGIAIPVADDPRDAFEQIPEAVLVDNPVLGAHHHGRHGVEEPANPDSPALEDTRDPV
ncbi:MFS transporter [Raineyella antarctica]|nr:MFS transporter [Raineyella antarctica]